MNSGIPDPDPETPELARARRKLWAEIALLPDAGGVEGVVAAITHAESHGAAASAAKIVELEARALRAERERDEARCVASKAYQDEMAADRVVEEAKRLLAAAYAANPLPTEDENDDRWCVAMAALSWASQGQRPMDSWGVVMSEISVSDALDAARGRIGDLENELYIWNGRALRAEATASELGQVLSRIAAMNAPSSEPDDPVRVARAGLKELLG